MPSNYRLMVIGNRSHSRYVLEHLLEEGWNVTSVVWANGDLGSQQAGHESIADLADRFDVSLIETEDINRERVREAIAATKPDIGICVGWTDIIGKETRSIPDDGILGFHFSELPKGRGGSPVNWQIIRGDDSVGVSCFCLVDEVDHGDIYDQTLVPIEERDDIETVYNRLTVATCDVLDDLLPELAEGTAESTAQPLEEATYFPQRKPADGIIDWDWSARVIFDWIRAQTKPYPGAFSFYRDEKLTVWEARVLDSSSEAEPGTVVDAPSGTGIAVATGTSDLRLTRVERPGSPPLWADEFAEREGLRVGTQLGSPKEFPEWLYTGIRDANGKFEYRTSGLVGETLRFQAVCCSHSTERSVRVTARLDGRTVHDERVRVRGWERVPIDIIVPERENNLLEIQFDDYETTIDIRRLKVYAATN